MLIKYLSRSYDYEQEEGGKIELGWKLEEQWNKHSKTIKNQKPKIKNQKKKEKKEKKGHAKKRKQSQEGSQEGLANDQGEK